MSSAVLFSLWWSGFILIGSNPVGALKVFLESAVVVKEHILRGACSPHYELNGNPAVSQKTDDGLCLKSQYGTTLCLSSCCWEYLHCTFTSVYCGEAPFHSPEVLSYERWRGSFCYGLSKVLATPVTWHSKEIFAMFRNARCSLCQHRSAKSIAWCFHNKMGCPEFSVCHWNTLRLLRGQYSIKSQLFHVNPDRPWFPRAKARLIRWLLLHLWNLPRTVF